MVFRMNFHSSRNLRSTTYSLWGSLFLIACASLAIPFVQAEDSEEGLPDYISDELVQETIKQVHAEFGPIVKEMTGRPIVNYRIEKVGMGTATNSIIPGLEGYRIQINMRPLLAECASEDSLAAVLCHEIGHSIATIHRDTKNTPFSYNEGLSDFFAVSCLRKVLPHLEGRGKKPLPRLLTIDARIARASVCNTFDRLPDISDTMDSSMKEQNRDRSKAKQTRLDHSQPQCRMDTFMAALECHNDLRDCQDLFPRCWFNPADPANAGL